MKASSSLGKIQDIEVLRALAVIAVLWQHADNLFSWQYPPLQTAFQYFGGTFGVDLFFCISGFVIARDLIPKLERSTSKYAWRVATGFWIKRMWRLWPAAWFWLAAILLATVFFNQSGAFGSFKANLHATWMAIFNLYNILFAQCFMRCQTGASVVYWSLSLEEQFYILFPALFILLRRRLWWLFGILIAIQIMLPLRSIWWMVFRSDAICLGVFIALVSQGLHWQAWRQWASKIPAWCGLLILCAGIALMGFLGGTNKWTSHYMSFIVITSAVLVVLAASDTGALMPPGRVKNLLTAVGARSYGIYLAHIPVYFAVREIFHRLDLQLPATSASVFFYVVLASVLLIIVVEVVYRYIEMPLRNIGAMKAKQWITPTFTAVQQPTSSFTVHKQ